MTARTPHLLEQYLALPPEASLIVLSGIIGASTNWLVLRYLASLLAPGQRHGDANVDGGDGTSGETAVLLVSFLRDFTFWRDGAGRLGVDLAALAKKGRFGFVDGLTGLFSDPALTSRPATPSSSRTTRRLVWGQPKPGLQGTAATLLEAIDDLALGAGGESQPSRRIFLVVDQPDLLLAATGSETTVTGVRDMLMSLREKVHACIVTLSADEPLVSAQTTTLEKEHASLLLSLAHEARTVLSLRMLDTGSASDVSGVLRITQGGGGHLDPGDTDDVEEHEYLYHVGGDGGVRVFERGAH